MNFLEDFTKEGKAIKDAIHLKNTQQFNPDPTASSTFSTFKIIKASDGYWRCFAMVLTSMSL